MLNYLYNQLFCSSEKRKKINFCFLLYVILLVAFSFWAHPDYWDDEMRLAAIADNGLSYILEGPAVLYNSQSPRILIELITLIFIALPPIFWRIANVFVGLLLYYEIDRIYQYISGSKISSAHVLPLLLCTYPFCLQATAGWLTTTIGYLWVSVFCLLVIISHHRYLYSSDQGTKTISIRNILYVFGLFAALLFCSNEIMVCGILLVYIAYELFTFSHNSKRNVSIKYYIPGFLITLVCICEIILAILSPGLKNRVNRTDQIFGGNKISPISAFRWASSSIIVHYIAIPSAIFFILLFVIAVAAKYSNAVPKTIKLTSAAVCLIYPLSILITYWVYLIPSGSITYIHFKPFPEGSESAAQWLLTLFLWTIGFITLYVLFHALNDTYKWGLAFITLFCGVGINVALGFTSGLDASLIRTINYMYLSIAIIILAAISKLKFNTFERVILMFSLYAGTFLNIAQTVRHILIYG